MRPRPKYHPPPAAPAPEPDPPWLAAQRQWLDLVDGAGQIVAACGDWGALMTLVTTGSLRPGQYRVDDVDGRHVAGILVDRRGSWQVCSAAMKRGS